MTQYLLNIVSPENHFKIRLIKNLSNHNIQYKDMGFPADWEQRNIWVIPQ